MVFVENNNYRNDIEGLRAIAVLSVIIFHLGYLPNGYLGVDIFFVISGYLITKIIYQESLDNHFSIVNFYIRRIRRIIPLVSFVIIISLIVGILVMLPDDLENLSQSIVATNFFSNNILQVLTTKNYWDVVNEFKPLMHTWSLAVEEQYYMLYPLIFLIFVKDRIKWILPLLIVLTIVSLILYLSPVKDYYKFYLLPFRFFELSIGGIIAIIMNKKLIRHNYSTLLLGLLVFMLYSDLSFLSANVLLMATTIVTAVLLISANTHSMITSKLLENRVMIGIGKISFSLYMWHQVVLAYSRYFVIKELTPSNLILLIVLIFTLSLISYYFVEQVFRNKKIVKTPLLLWSTGIATIMTTAASFYIYVNAGVLKDIPELNIKKSEVIRNMHAQYNAKIYEMDKSFSTQNKIKVLVIGNSFARDWVNILLESKFKDTIEISYIYDIKTHKELRNRVAQANFIFVSEASKSIIEEYSLDDVKTWCVGTKNFGISNGLPYNYQGENYYKQRTHMEDGFIEKNNLLEKEWGDKYINLIGMIIDKNDAVPVFTKNHKFISQDCRHLTKPGATFFADILYKNLKSVFNNANKNNTK